VAELPAAEKIRRHYELEKALAQRILRAPREERARVTLDAYDELFRAITWHPGRQETEASRRQSEASYRVFLRLAGRDQDVLEIGCGRGTNVRKLAPRNRRCVGIDISEQVLDLDTPLPSNAALRVADACDLSIFADDSFDVAFSKQLVEHIHPDDLPRHLAEVHRVVRPGGRYVFETPNAVSGPHDVSRHFDDTSTCFHLREYSFATIMPLLREAGFRTFRTPLFRDRVYELSPLLGRLTEVPVGVKRFNEQLLSLLPRRRRRAASRFLRVNVFIIAGK
jgi:SAM-dependent methyltransferase